MSLRVIRSLTRLGGWLIRKIRQVQHNMSHCGILSWRGKQAKRSACNLVPLRIQFNSRTEFSHLKKRKKEVHHLSQAHQPWLNMVVLLESTSTMVVEHGGVVGK